MTGDVPSARPLVRGDLRATPWARPPCDQDCARGPGTRVPHGDLVHGDPIDDDPLIATWFTAE